MILGRVGRGIVTSPLGFKICTARIASIASGGSPSPPGGIVNGLAAPDLSSGEPASSDLSSSDRPVAEGSTVVG
jgi:hypothetical protein